MKGDGGVVYGRGKPSEKRREKTTRKNGSLYFVDDEKKKTKDN